MRLLEEALETNQQRDLRMTLVFLKKNILKLIKWTLENFLRV